MKNILIVVGVIAVVIVGYLLLTENTTPTNVTYSEETTTFTSDSDSMTVQYNDDAAYAKISYGGEEYELERTRSASGAKYQNADGSVVFWEHQGEATLEIDGERVVVGSTTETDKAFTFTNGEQTFTIMYSDSADTATLGYNSKEYELQRERSASGARYESTDGSVIFWEHQGEATLEIDGKTVVDGAENTVAMSNDNMMTISVGPERRPCTGVGPRECLEVDGKLFYDVIEGFEYEPGFEYVLEIERTKRENVPADASAYSYTLIETVSKTPVLDSANSVSESVALSGTWRWVETQYNNDESIAPIDLNAFTLSFSESGRVGITTDCNNGSGSYELDGNQLAFGPIAATKKACLGETQESDFFALLNEVQSYSMNDSTLVLELQLDSGTMIFTEVVD